MISDLIRFLTFCRVFVLTIGRDLSALKSLLYIVAYKLPWLQRHQKTCARLLEDQAKNNPYKDALIQAETGKKWNFHQLNEYANAVGNYFQLHSGISAKNTVALLCDNRPEYAGIWLGLNKVGIVPALVNYKVTGKGLKHCLEIVNCKAVIVLTEFLDNVIECGLDKDILVYELKADPDLPSVRKGSDNPGNAELYDISKVIDLNERLEKSSRLPVEKPYLLENLHDTQLFIYTSGTTGLPKAAKVSMNRFGMFAFGTANMFGMKTSDIFYSGLPLYHSNAGMIVLGQTIARGNTVILRKKFSASSFWTDCVQYKATAFNYIGEICRFLLAKKVTPVETQHNIRFIIGNGLKPELWRVFVDRFEIPCVKEFYGATEGVANIANTQNKEGSVGFITRIAPSLYPVTIVKVDPETEEPLRDPVSGLVQLADVNEIGMVVGKMADSGFKKFEGYHDKKLNNSKVIENCQSKGDKYFMTGDLACADELGWVTFKDRVGDTFRWKGENCSTAEVDAAASNVLKDNDLAVACVSCTVPGNDGNAGLLVVDVSKKQGDEQQIVEIVTKLNELFNILPAYQVPVFVRCALYVEVTGSFKIQKAKLKKIGYDLGSLPEGDRVFVASKGKYVEVDEQMMAKINNCEIRF